MRKYLCLNNQEFEFKEFKISPIRKADRYLIMKWRNQQIYHLRQNKLLTKSDQDNYFSEVVDPLFITSFPSQILFSFLKNDKCIGYGGLVHINWIDLNAEISFIMDTQLEDSGFEENWNVFLKLIERIAFHEISLNKIYTYAYDIRPKLFTVLVGNNYTKEAQLKNHVKVSGVFCDVLIHSKFNFLEGFK